MVASTFNPTARARAAHRSPSPSSPLSPAAPPCCWRWLTAAGPLRRCSRCSIEARLNVCMVGWGQGLRSKWRHILQSTPLLCIQAPPYLRLVASAVIRVARPKGRRHHGRGGAAQHHFRRFNSNFFQAERPDLFGVADSQTADSRVCGHLSTTHHLLTPTKSTDKRGRCCTSLNPSSTRPSDPGLSVVLSGVGSSNPS